MMQLSFYAPFGGLDIAALALLGLSYVIIGWWIEHPGMKRPSMTLIMAERRRAWMREMVMRDVRIFDSQIMASLRQGTSFFASTNIFAIGGVLALIGNVEPISGLTEQVTHTAPPPWLIQAKLALVGVFLVIAFLKFVWAHRVFGYCSVLMAAVPQDQSHPEAFGRAAQAAELNVRAAANYNRGLRAMYYALAALGWLVGPWMLVAATIAVVWLVWSREFASMPRTILLGDAP